MMRLVIICLLIAQQATAEVLVAARTIPANALIEMDDLTWRDIAQADGVTDAALLVGKEAQIALFAGRPIRITDVGPPAVVVRNQVIPVVYQTSGLTIKAEGRALDRAAAGESIRIMNLASRNTVQAVIDEFGVAHVSR